MRRHLDRSESIVRIGSLLSMGVGVVVVAGWLLEITWLKSTAAILPHTSPFAALTFLLAGASVLAWNLAFSPHRPALVRQRLESVARWSAGLLIACALAYLACSIAASSFGQMRAGHLFFANPLDFNGEKMAATTALSLVLLGLGLALVKEDKYRWYFQSFFLGMAGVAVLGISQYLYGGSIFPQEQQMAFSTGAVLLLLAFAALHLRPELGIVGLAMDRGTAGRLMRRLLPAAIVVPLAFGLLQLQAQQAALFSPETGLTLYALALALVFATLIGWNARHVQKADLHRKRAEGRLRASLREIVDLNTAIDEHSIVAITDTAGRINFVNDKFCDLSKFPRAELLGKDHRIVNSGFHPKEFFRDLWETIAAGKIWRGDLKNRAKDGSFYWINTVIVPFVDDAGKPLRYVAIGTDLTAHILAEEEIQTLNRELEQRVQSRTVELESANKELEAFSYSVSHDLRSPLRAMNGFSEAVLEDYGPQLPEDGQRLLRTIRENAQKMSRLIDDLLEFSRLSRAKLTKREIPTETLVRSVLEDLAMDRQNREIDIEIGALPVSHGDPALLRQVWVNLLSNALKYSRQRARAVIEIGGSVTDGIPSFYVRDNGTGFDPRYAHKLFGVFQRLHRAEEFEGTGVGLAIVQRIVHRHGGRISAEAAVDKGATFTFTLEGEPIL